MGNNKGKTQARSEDPFLSSDENKNLKKAFTDICRRNSLELCGRHELSKSWEKSMEKELFLLFMANFFQDQTEKKIEYQTYLVPYIKLARSPSHDTAEFIISILRRKPGETVGYSAVLQYVKNILSSYLTILKVTNNVVLNHWLSLNFPILPEEHKRIAELLCQDFQEAANPDDIEDSIVKWLDLCAQFLIIQTHFICKLYQVPQEQVSYGDFTAEHCLLPMCKEEPKIQKGSCFSVLNISQILFLNSLLSQELQLEWRFCFSTKIHGESFSKMLGLITNQGPTLIIVQDKKDHLFGGFASQDWSLNPNFHGTEKSFLFTLFPKIKVYESTGYNNHYQYLNINQQTLPNGLGMGGQFEYFAIWLDAEFGKGHSSESCTTYKNCKMLSATKHFEIDHVEVWGVGPKLTKTELDEMQLENIAEKQREAQALLQIAGTKIHSEGFRDEK